MKHLPIDALDLACGGAPDDIPFEESFGESWNGMQTPDYGPGGYSSSSFDAMFESASQAPPVWGSESRVLNYLSRLFPTPPTNAREEYMYPTGGLRG